MARVKARTCGTCSTGLARDCARRVGARAAAMGESGTLHQKYATLLLQVAGAFAMGSAFRLLFQPSVAPESKRRARGYPVQFTVY